MSNVTKWTFIELISHHLHLTPLRTPHCAFLHSFLFNQPRTRPTRTCKFSGSDLMIWSNSANCRRGHTNRRMWALIRKRTLLVFTVNTKCPDEEQSLSHAIFYKMKCLDERSSQRELLSAHGFIQSIRCPTLPGRKKTFVRPNLKSSEFIPRAWNKAWQKRRGCKVASLAGRKDLYLTVKITQNDTFLMRIRHKQLWVLIVLLQYINRWMFQ